eukprot:1368703-Amorphochlora_amoeboformis.AAC.2
MIKFQFQQRTRIPNVSPASGVRGPLQPRCTTRQPPQPRFYFGRINIRVSYHGPTPGKIFSGDA